MEQRAMDKNQEQDKDLIKLSDENMYRKFWFFMASTGDLQMEAIGLPNIKN